MNSLIWLFILTLLPIFELRLTIPLGILSGSMKLPVIGNIAGFGLPWWQVFAVCTIANILVILPIFFFLDFFNLELMHLKWYEKLFNFFLRKAQKKIHKLEPQINKYGYPALAIFVGIPLPMTGAWTGALIAWILGLDRKKSFAAIAAGVLLAAIIVTAVTLGSIGLFRIAFS